jgi:hypothetical protein
MAWNLVTAISGTSSTRDFFVPMDELSEDAVLEFTETAPADRLTDAVLKIRLQPPSGGFPGLPDPKLHAMGAGRIRFIPADSSHADRLELTLYLLLTSVFRSLPDVGSVFPKWWDRWRETQSIPTRVAYENVDRDSVRAILNAVPAPIDEKRENRIPLSQPVRFPHGVVQGMSKTLFIDSFMNGEADYFIEVSAGAVIGLAGEDPDSPPGPMAPRVLALHAEYAGHSAQTPRPMNPRELLYLLFGDDSLEATSRPFLLKLNEYGNSQAGHESLSMLLRPPFRTHRRLKWEAEIEVKYGAGAWGPGVECKERLYNTHAREGLSFARNLYKNSWKCNLLVFDVALRAGFRAQIQKDSGGTMWLYGVPDGVSRKVDKAPLVGSDGTGSVALLGRIQSDPVPWAYKIEGRLRSEAGIPLVMTRVAEIFNEMMNSEGRCLAYVLDYADSTGHMGLVEEIKEVALATSGHGLTHFVASTWEATGNGAVHRRSDLEPDVQIEPDREWSTDPTHVRILHIFELSAGRDPDTHSGLANCNVEA